MDKNIYERKELRKAKFQQQNLEKFSFIGADLRGANFKQAILCNAIFTEAKLHGADFSGANLKGANFTDASIKDVSEGNLPCSGSVSFIGANIQGTKFANATLPQANFSNSLAGVNDIYPYVIGAGTVFIALCSCFTSTIIGIFTVYYLQPKFFKNPSFFVFLWSFIISVFLIVSLRTLALKLPISIVQEPITVHVILGILLIAATILIVIGTTINFQEEDRSDTKSIVFIVVVFIFILFLFLGSSIFIEPESLLIHYFPELGKIVKGLGTTTQGKWLAGIMGAIIGGGLGWWFSKLALQGDRRFSWLWKCYVGLTASGGTIFSGADLSDANFTGASLKGAKFKTEPFHYQKTRCQRINWYDAKNLEYANIEGLGYLTIPKVQRLVTTRQVTNHCPGDNNFNGLNLEGIYLESATLSQLSCVGTNFKGANLRYTMLNGATLTNTNLNGADMTGANLTGACLKNVTIDANTKLDGVECQYVFLEEFPNPETGIKERLPHDTDSRFQPGEFEKRFRHKHKSGTLQLLITGDNNREALTAAFVHLIKDNESLQIDDLKRGVTPVDSDILLEFSVPNATNKGAIERTFQGRAKSGEEISKAEITQNPEFSKILESISNQQHQSLYDFIINLIGVIGENMNPRSESHHHTNNFHNRGDNYGNQAVSVGRDQNYNVTEQDLTRAATEIQQLLEQLSQASQANKEGAVVSKIEEQIQVNPTLKNRLRTALINGGTELLKQVLDSIYGNPIVSVSVETIKGFLEAE